MKHDLRIVLALIALFFVAQVVGLGLVYQDIKVDRAVINGTEVITVYHPETSLGPRPEVRNFDALLLILVSLVIGTGLILAIIKLDLLLVWKGFFSLAVFFSLSITFGVILNSTIAIILGLFLTYYKMKKYNVVVYNLTEILIYSGITILFVPLLNPLWTIILLVIISGYDMFAVWKSKHMVKMAEYQMKSSAFAGLSIPYKPHRPHIKYARKVKVVNKTGQTQAILGGGDVAFPMLFAASFMESLVAAGSTGIFVFLQAMIIPVVTTISLGMLLFYGKKGHFYPAMPFLTIGCLVGYAIALVV